MRSDQGFRVPVPSCSSRRNILRAVMEPLGHSLSSVTMNPYAHVLPEAQTITTHVWLARRLPVKAALVFVRLTSRL